MHAHCSSGCGGHPRWPCPCPPTGNPRLADATRLVDCYQLTQGALAAEAAYYAQLPDIAVALREALAALIEEAGLRPGHRPLASAAAAPLCQALLPVVAPFVTGGDFAALHAGLLQAGAEFGLTPIAAYDTALRLGMQTGTAPEKIFTHAGNHAALVSLGLDCGDNGWLDPARLPAALQPLTPADCELCLCLCGDQWRWLAAQPKETP